MSCLKAVCLVAALIVAGCDASDEVFDPRVVYRGEGDDTAAEQAALQRFTRADAFFDADLLTTRHVLVAAPSGTGSACSQAQPCALLEAKAQAAGLSEHAASDIVLLLMDGVYRLDAPLRFTAADSGKHGHKIIWWAARDAHPVVSGAIEVTGWKRIAPEQNLWRSKLERTVPTRQLYIDGVRANVAQGRPPVELHGDATGYTASDMTYATWRNPHALEFVYVGGNGEWTETRCRVAAVDGMRLTMSQPCWNNATQRPEVKPPAFGPKNLDIAMVPTRIENAFELMQEGQWYLDPGSAELFYHARPGEDLTLAQVELPVLEQLIVGEGTLEEPVHDLEFRGIGFAHATWNQPSGPLGFADLQAGISVTGALDAPPQGTCNFSQPMGTCPYGAYSAQPANVTFRHAHNIAFIRNRFEHLGATALAFTDGSLGNRISGNVFRDISGNAITIGNTDTLQPSDPGADERTVCALHTLDNNLITEIGAEYHGAVGILLLVTQRTVVRNNEIRDVPYTAISSGAIAGHANIPSSPDTTTSFNRDNVISQNLIYRYLTVLDDGGAIYLEGHQNQSLYDDTGALDLERSYRHGLEVAGNVVFHQGGRGNALYNDIGSQWIIWRDNIQWQARSANGGCLPVGHIHFIDNYHSDRLRDFGCGKPIDFHYDGNVQIPRRPSASDLPSRILSHAGLEPSYWDLGTGPAPRIEYVSPSSGSAAAPTRVLIAGSGFDSDTSVAWDDAEAHDVEVLSSNFLLASAPAGADFARLRLMTAQGSRRMRVNDTDASIQYTGVWKLDRQHGNYDDDTQHITSEHDASFRYRFEGTGIEVLTTFDSDRGDIAVYLDGALHETRSCFAPSRTTQTACARITDLARGRHVLEVKKKGGQHLSLDALQVWGD